MPKNTPTFCAKCGAELSARNTTTGLPSCPGGLPMILEYEERAQVCVVRGDNYNGNLGYLLDMFEVAQKDFPDLLPQDVIVQKYAGDRHKRQYGIEFKMRREVPDKYSRILQLERTFLGGVDDGVSKNWHKGRKGILPS